jgi:Zinc finger, C2H2 type/C2H2-type zinc finger
MSDLFSSEIWNQIDTFIDTDHKISREEKSPTSSEKDLTDFCSFYICKLCLKLIDSGEKHDDENLTIYEKLEFIMEKSYKEGMHLNFICTECHKNVDQFYNFKRQCERNIQFLNEINLNFTTKNDDDDEKYRDDIEEFAEIEISATNEISIEDNSQNVQKPASKGSVCEICGKVVKGIQMHKLIHFNVKKFKCDIGDCGKSFTQSGQLRRHINSHLNIRNYSCPHPDCDRKFVDPSSVTKHLVVHNKEDRKFVCSICAARFNRLGALRYHEKTHRQERNHKCSVCEKSFLAKYDLKKHFRVR